MLLNYFQNEVFVRRCVCVCLFVLFFVVVFFLFVCFLFVFWVVFFCKSVLL